MNLNPILLRQALGERPFRYFDSTTSTMQDAQTWLAENPNLPSGAVVIADEQRQGKGRLGRGWMTPPATAIAMSLIIRGQHLPEQMTMLGAVSVAETLDVYAPTTLKWSNDVQIAGKKVCGILAESVWDGDKHLASIIGMGVNMSVNFAGSELADKATSLNHHTEQPIDRAAIIASILIRADHWLASLRTHITSQYAGLTPSPVYTAWKSRLSTLGQRVTLYNGNASITGLAVDVDPQGALLLETETGMQRFLAGDVSLSPPL